MGHQSMSPFQPALGERQVGLLDLTGQASPELFDATITDSSGNVVAWVQE